MVRQTKMHKYDSARQRWVVQEWDVLSPTHPFYGWRGVYRRRSRHGPTYVHFPFAFFVVLKGGLRFWERSGAHVLRQGDMAFIGPWEPHSGEILAPGTQRLTIIFLPAFLVDCSFSDAALLLPFLDPMVRRLVQPKTEQERKKILAHARLIRDALEEKTVFGLRLARLEFEALLLDATRRLSKRYPARIERGHFGECQRIFAIFDYVRDHLHGSITLREAAKAVRMNRRQFSRLFRQITRQSFTKYILLTRLVNARNQILTTNKKLSVIAAEFGFTDASHLIRRFKCNFGVRPGQLPRGGVPGLSRPTPYSSPPFRRQVMPASRVLA